MTAPLSQADLGRSNKRVTVLIVEDDDDARESVADVLRDEGYDVLTARDGVEALEYLDRIPPPSAMVLDLSLPRVGGLEVLQRMREREYLAQVHICVLSGQRELPTDVELAIHKPLLVHRLVQVQKWLEALD